ncbi:MAG: Bd3614 family nucleic acid deaminase [Deltaproteobacteria bacterium]|nr:Bd3614 family nucleic acid deaminase [Deltaproteobacteria bacterium]
MGKKHHEFVVPLEAKAIAHFLLAKVGGEEVSWIQRDSFWFWARSTTKEGGETSVMNLLQGVYEKEAKLAQWIFRARTFSTQPFDIACAAAAKLAGGKISFDVESVDDGVAVSSNAAWVEVTKDAEAARTTAASFAFASPFTPGASEEYAENDVGLRQEIHSLIDDEYSKEGLERRWRSLSETSKKDAEKGEERGIHRDVFAALVESVESGKTSEMDGDNVLFCVGGIARNFAARNKTQHAEMVLLQSCKAAGISLRGKSVWVTLQCCRMCAAHLVREGVVEVVYGQEDPGRLATHTELQKLGLERVLT